MFFAWLVTSGATLQGLDIAAGILSLARCSLWPSRQEAAHGWLLCQFRVAQHKGEDGVGEKILQVVSILSYDLVERRGMTAVIEKKTA